MEEFSAAIYSTKEVALNIYEVTFKLGTPLFFEPGQSIELCLSHAAADDKRSDCQKLPIVSSVDSKNLLTVVLRDTNSSFERSLLDLPAGGKVLIRGPFGIFCLPNKPQQEVVFIAGGIGIASFMSMIQVSLNRNIKTPVTLLYANVNSEQALYVKELEEIRVTGVLIFLFKETWIILINEAIPIPPAINTTSCCGLFGKQKIPNGPRIRTLSPTGKSSNERSKLELVSRSTTVSKFLLSTDDTIGSF